MGEGEGRFVRFEGRELGKGEGRGVGDGVGSGDGQLEGPEGMEVG